MFEVEVSDRLFIADLGQDFLSPRIKDGRRSFQFVLARSMLSSDAAEEEQEPIILNECVSSVPEE